MRGYQTGGALEVCYTTIRTRAVNEQLGTPHRERGRSTWR